MNLGIGLSLTSFQRVPTVPLEDLDAAIAALFQTGTPGVYYEGAWYDPSDSTTVWQDAAGTTPATVGDPVGRIDDKSGNGNHATQSTSAARPVLQQSGDLYYLDFDGVDDSMAVTFASAQAQPNSIGVGFKFDDYTIKVYDFVYDGVSSTARHVLFDNAGTMQASAGTAMPCGASTTSDEVNLVHFNTTSSSVRRNGSEVATGDVSAQSWGGILLAKYWANPFNNMNGRIYSFVGVNRTLTAGEITDLETYLASKSGVTI